MQRDDVLLLLLFTFASAAILQLTVLIDRLAATYNDHLLFLLAPSYFLISTSVSSSSGNF